MGCFRALMPVVARPERLAAHPCARRRRLRHCGGYPCRNRERQIARTFWHGAAGAGAMVAGARLVPEPVGSRDREIRLAAAALLSAAAGDHRSLYRRPPE